MTRSLNGGVDEIPLPRPPGRLWLCGKHFIGPDPNAGLRRSGATVAVCLNQRYELEDRFPDYVQWLLHNQPARAIWHPIPDLHAPTVDEANGLIGQVVDRLEHGEGVLMHCGAGIGRAGTIAVGVLIAMGVELDEALDTVGRHRPMAGPEVGAQQALVEALAHGF